MLAEQFGLEKPVMKTLMENQEDHEAATNNTGTIGN